MRSQWKSESNLRRSGNRSKQRGKGKGYRKRLKKNKQGEQLNRENRNNEYI